MVNASNCITMVSCTIMPCRHPEHQERADPQAVIVHHDNHDHDHRHDHKDGPQPQESLPSVAAEAVVAAGGLVAVQLLQDNLAKSFRPCTGGILHSTDTLPYRTASPVSGKFGERPTGLPM